VQLSVYVDVEASAPVEAEPLSGLLPDQAPDAVQEVAFVVDQVRVDAEPEATVLGFALSVTVAVGSFVTVTVVD
jgi:hypothetical protein